MGGECEGREENLRLDGVFPPLTLHLYCICILARRRRDAYALPSCCFCRSTIRLRSSQAGQSAGVPALTGWKTRGTESVTLLLQRDIANGAVDNPCLPLYHRALCDEGNLAMALQILVADQLAKEGLDLLKSTGSAFDEKIGLKEDELAAEVGKYDALIVRSGAKVTAKVLANPGKLKAIARAGVGVDNIDLEAATAKGILVLNTAEASTLSTAEHALALMMSLARKIPQAHAHVKSAPDKWKKTQYQGTQLAGKTLGVVGLGRIGRTVASRAIAMEMNVLGFDPFFTRRPLWTAK